MVVLGLRRIDYTATLRSLNLVRVLFFDHVLELGM